MKIPHDKLDATALLNAAEACGRESCRATLPLFLRFHSKVKAMMKSGLVFQNDKITRILRDEIRDNANSLIEMACLKMAPFRFVDTKIALLKNKWGDDQQRDWALVKKKKLEEARQMTRRLVSQWCDARKCGVEVSQEIGAEAEEHLREAFSFRALEASIAYYIQRRKTPEEVMLFKVYNEIMPSESDMLDKVFNEVLEAVLVIFGQQKATIGCRDLFKILE